MVTTVIGTKTHPLPCLWLNCPLPPTTRLLRRVSVLRPTSVGPLSASEVMVTEQLPPEIPQDGNRAPSHPVGNVCHE